MMERRDPNMKKSYHSNTVPAADAVSTSLIRAACGFADATAMTSLPFAEIANGPREASQGNYSAGFLLWRRHQSAAVHFRNLASQKHLFAVTDESMQNMRDVYAIFRERKVDRLEFLHSFIQPICAASRSHYDPVARHFAKYGVNRLGSRLASIGESLHNRFAGRVVREILRNEGADQTVTEVTLAGQDFQDHNPAELFPKLCWGDVGARRHRTQTPLRLPIIAQKYAGGMIEPRGVRLRDGLAGIKNAVRHFSVVSLWKKSCLRCVSVSLDAG